MNKGAIYEYHFLCGPLRSEQQSLGGNPSSEERTSSVATSGSGETGAHTTQEERLHSLTPPSHMSWRTGEY